MVQHQLVLSRDEGAFAGVCDEEDGKDLRLTSEVFQRIVSLLDARRTT
ncbi:hypothetical protein DSOL_4517 [Desulfosporosinus metallidurans]|uniref:Uncharacterized protein n=1 Tax=Desulfosporosinus metallidurans TaxID=1888891 RepID=A0A1Q8QJE0_9FIRM|nr:hypothetical protein DSOL_4517 [Desulfosporosinus metallidurans]